MDEYTDEVKDLATEPLKRKNFNFAEMIRDRTFPEITVPVYLDEALALRLAELAEEEAVIDHKVLLQGEKGMSDAQRDALARIEEERESVLARMEPSKYTAVIRGFSYDDQNTLRNKAFEQFSVEYRETKNELTGTITREEIESEERVDYFNDLLWNKALVRLVAPDGAVADPMSVEETRVFRRNVPHATRLYIDKAVDKVQMATDWYKGLADEVFSPRP